jgi:hypothetical protein
LKPELLRGAAILVALGASQPGLICYLRPFFVALAFRWDMDMASDASGHGRNHGNNDAVAQETYSRFMSLTKWAVIFVVVVLLLMALLLV